MSPPRIRATVSRSELVRAPNLAWNAFIDLLTETPYEELSAEQRVAYLAFWYDREVQNGGHALFLRRVGDDRVDETVAALKALGGHSQAQVLSQASGCWGAAHQSGADTGKGPEPRGEEALETELDRLDRAYHACEPELPALLQDYLEARQEDFIEVVDS